MDWYTVTVYRDMMQCQDAEKGYRDRIHRLHGYRESRKGQNGSGKGIHGGYGTANSQARKHKSTVCIVKSGYLTKQSVG